jgi:allantoinase
MTFDVVLRSRRVVLDAGERPAAVCVSGGRIAAIEPYDAVLAAGAGHDYGDLALLPGLVDTHVHVNEPGRTEWEGFATATRAAAAGGVTTILDMPLNSIPPTVSVDALETKRRAAHGRCRVDVGFWGGAVPGNAADLAPLHEAGVFGFKCFLVDSGVPEFPPLPADAFETALRQVPGALFVVHAEDPAALRPFPGSPRYTDFVDSRPSDSEELAVATVLDAAARTGTRVHILHLSSARAVPLLAAARSRGVAATAETCPHYLALTAEEVPDGATEFKCCPPIRDGANRDELWRALAEDVIACVVSDHSPSTPDLKRGDFGTAWGGIASLQLGLPVVWTQARRRGHTLADVARWMARRPAELAGLRRKGQLAPGFDADVAVVDPDATFVVDPAALHHRHPVSPYAGRRLHGVVRATWLRGEPAGDEPHGRLLVRGLA